MNKFDIRLCLIIFIVSLVLVVISKIPTQNPKIAKVYYENNEVLKIDLSNNGNYQVNGYNGVVNLEVKDGMIKVTDEISPKHLCSKQGYISKSYESIICLPNKVVVKIEDEDEIDTVVSVWN